MYYVPTPPSNPLGIRTGHSGGINYFHTKAEAVRYMRRYHPVEVKNANAQSIDWKTDWITEIRVPADLA